MRNIGIVTLNGYYNYGNRLQNYALQEVVESLGFDVETIINNNQAFTPKRNGYHTTLNKLKDKSMNDIIKSLNNKISNTYFQKENKISECLRTEIFKEFTTNYIKETNFSISKNNLPNNLSDKYSLFITGSDQVWNPDYIYGSSINFLTFAENTKKIAYAPSFGVSEIPDDLTEKYRKWISDFEYLSVREEEGSNIIYELTGRHAQVLVDPTLLLTKEKWLSIAKAAKNKPEKKYLLTYFLGGIPNSYKSEIKKIAKKNNLQVINLGDIREKEAYRTGPSEFLDYINSCSIFCTDSFHGTVFSILFQRPFIVFEREGLSSSMFSRINTLLKKFDLNSRKAENILWKENIFDVDYSLIQKILEEERNEANTYLINALGEKTKEQHKKIN